MADVYVAPAPTGNDSTGNGSLGSPYATIKKGCQIANPGDTVYVLPGTFAGETFDSSCNGSSGSPVTVRAYSTQVTINSRTVFTTGVADISFIGNDDVRLGATDGTFLFYNSSNSQHVIEQYGTRIKIRGCKIDHGGGYLGSCVAMGWNGQTGQWRAIECEVTHCYLTGIGTDPSYGPGDAGHDHGLYLNYNLDCVISYNVIEDILGGWGIHLYTESGSARHVDNTTVTFNTIRNTRDGGIILASAGSSTTQNTNVDNNLLVDCGDTSLDTGAYGFMVYWGGPTGTGNTGTDNHGYLNADGNVQPGMTGWTLDTPSTGDPLLVDPDNMDWHLEAGSPAEGIGAFPTIETPAQLLAPSADSVDGNWTDNAGGSALAAAIDETTPADSDYILSTSDPQDSGCRVKLASGSDPSLSTGHVIHWRARKDSPGGTALALTVKLYQGGGNSQGAGTLIASFTRSDVSGSDWTTFDETLSGAQADSITDYADLYLEFSANQT